MHVDLVEHVQLKFYEHVQFYDLIDQKKIDQKKKKIMISFPAKLKIVCTQCTCVQLTYN